MPSGSAWRDTSKLVAGVPGAQGVDASYLREMRLRLEAEDQP